MRSCLEGDPRRETGTTISYEFFFFSVSKQTDDSLKARTFFIFSCFPHNTSMNLGPEEALPGNSLDDALEIGLGLNQKSFEWLGDGSFL